jgi:serine/threonine protein kinase
MGVVAEATHLGLDERVALKFLRPDAMNMPDVVARFDREARAAVKLKSEHVARVSAVGKTDDGIPFMVMELLAGKDLAQMLTENGPLPISEAVEYVIQACEGVGEAHARGIVHRDIKPENLFVVQRTDTWNLVKVLDFGISKAVLIGASGVDMSSSNTSSIMGSPYYMSPEQLRSTRTVDHRSDIWSLGVVLFELLTGTTIFDDTHEFTELVADILEAPHRRLGAYRPDAPPALEQVVDRCLEKDRTKRFQNVAELAVALLPFAPKRARVTAERTTSIARAAGLITDPSFQLPPSIYPPAPASGDSVPSGMLAAPKVPALGDTSAPNLQQAAGSLAAGTLETTITTRKQVPFVALIFGAVLLLGVGVALAYGVIRAFRPAPIAIATQPLPPTQATVTDPPPATGTATATVTATATATVAVTVTAPATAKPPRGGTHPTATSTTSATAAPTHPTLDIQLQR